jgi:hypothetical protein
MDTRPGRFRVLQISKCQRFFRAVSKSTLDQAVKGQYQQYSTGQTSNSAQSLPGSLQFISDLGDPGQRFSTQDQASYDQHKADNIEEIEYAHYQGDQADHSLEGHQR